jgi:hypothetical protein
MRRILEIEHYLGQAPNGDFTVQGHGIASHGTMMGIWLRSSLDWWLESTRFKIQGYGWQRHGKGLVQKQTGPSQTRSRKKRQFSKSS